ncbi:PepSY domain-containing protein [Lewinella lacunae]|uniref:PepSY domain-containing protein n=1 Tax=Neolewinella lacunae TaxID=1517758 RepID=A0A923PK20_9BACT|nr:PepSY domain-containing protein [Neolewinella lacunae]
MTPQQPTSLKMRIWHRYLGFFLSGIMAIYAISGIVLIFRQTNTFKVANTQEMTLAPNLTAEALGQELKIRDFKVESTQGDILTFKDGTYNQATGATVHTKYALPFVLDKLTHLHKATTKDTLFFLNIFFGLSLFFFVVSAFWMYMPSGPILRKGLLFAAGGVLLALVMLFV